MDAEFYIELETNQRGGWDLPPFCWNDEDEFDAESMYDRLEKEGYITQDNNTFLFTDRDRFEKDYPNLFALLKTIHDAEVQETLDLMVDDGLITMYISDEGEACYSLTEKGAIEKELIEQSGEMP